MNKQNTWCVALFSLTFAASTGCVGGSGAAPQGDSQDLPGPGPGGSEAGNPKGDIVFSGGKLVPGGSCGSAPSGTLVGNGDIVDQPRAVTGFTKIRQEAVLTTSVTQAPSFAVSVRIDSNLQDIVTTTLENDALVFRATKSFCTHTMPSATVALPRFTGAALIGVGDLTVTGITGSDPVALANDGVGDLTFSGNVAATSLEQGGVGMAKLTGKSDRLDITFTGTGDIDATGLAVTDATVDTSGVGNIAIAASHSVSLTAGCIGEITVTGSAAVSGGRGSQLCQVHVP